jgi:hypothetical protein
MYRKLTLLFSTVVATGALCFGVAAAAGQRPNHTPTKARQLQRACTRGTTLWAVVNPNGTLARASTPGTTSNQEVPFTGDYEVIFPLNVRNAAYVVSPGSPGALGVAPVAETSVQGDNDNVGGVFLRVEHAGKGSVEGFHLVVTC